MIIALIISMIFVSLLSAFFARVTNRFEKERFQEFVRAVLARDIDEYNNSIPEVGPKEELPVQDELEDIAAVDEHILIKHLKKEYEDIES